MVNYGWLYGSMFGAVLLCTAQIFMWRAHIYQIDFLFFFRIEWSRLEPSYLTCIFKGGMLTCPRKIETTIQHV